MATSYRLCGPADLDEFTELVVGWLRGEGRLPSPAAVRRSLERLLGDTRVGHGWIIERGGAPAGYAILTFSDQDRAVAPRGYVTALYVVPERRGQGIGSRTERFLREVGLWLGVPVHCFDTVQESKHAALLLRHDALRLHRITQQDQAVA
jgi:GNAT superfamily N-acetyltransferase